MSAKPRLKAGVIVRRLKSREETYVIVKDPETRKYFKFEEWEGDVFALLDGTRDLEEIAQKFSAAHPEIGADTQSVLDYIEGLKGLDLIERSEREQHLVMMDKLKNMRKKRFYDAEKSTLFQIHIPLFDPNKLLDRFIPKIRWWWSPWFVISWLAVFVVVLGFLLSHWSLYWSGFFSLWNFPEKTLFDWIGFFALLFGVSIWHELGHGFACKRFGGEVHDIGFMIFYFQPAFYCGVDDSYLFSKRSHRIFATFGGAYFELMMCSVACALWLATPAEWWIHTVALTVVFFTGLSVIVLNVNPLVRLDGYYVLMDFLDVPNLREESFEYLGNIIKKNIFRLEIPAKPISRRKRRIYFIYGVLSMAYTITIMSVLLTFVRRWLITWLGPAGYLVLLGLVLFAFRKKVRDAARFIRHFWLDKKELARSGPRPYIALLGGVALLALLTIPRSATRIENDFRVEPGETAYVQAPADGMVRSVSISEGQAVEKGQILAVLESGEIEAALWRAESGREWARLEAIRAHSTGDPATERQRTGEMRAAQMQLEALRRRSAGLTLTAPIDGIVATANLGAMRGRFLGEGAKLCEIESLDRVRLVVDVPENDIDEIGRGTAVRMLAAAYPGTTLRAEVRSVAPVAEPPGAGGRNVLDLVHRVNLVRVSVEVDNHDRLLKSGMGGRVQFLGKPRSAVGKVWWRFRRWAGTLFW